MNWIINALATMLTEFKLGYGAGSPVTEVGEMLYTVTHVYYTNLMTDVVTVFMTGLVIISIVVIGYSIKKSNKKSNVKGYLKA